MDGSRSNLDSGLRTIDTQTHKHTIASNRPGNA